MNALHQRPEKGMRHEDDSGNSILGKKPAAGPKVASNSCLVAPLEGAISSVASTQLQNDGV